MCILVADELSSILKKLSLENYNPIFEEQEVFSVLYFGMLHDNLGFRGKKRLNETFRTETSRCFL